MRLPVPYSTNHPGFVDIQLVITAPTDIDIRPGDTIRLESPTSVTKVKVGYNIKAREGEQFALTIKGRLEMFIDRKD